MEDESLFSDVWETLNKKQKRTRIKRSYIELKKAWSNQSKLLNEYEQDPSNSEKKIGFHYFFNTINEIWRLADFVDDLGRGKNKKFVFYPVRSILENTYRLSFYVDQKSSIQDDIALKEMMRISKRFYDFADNDIQREKMKKMYESFSTLGEYPGIEESKLNSDPFPDMKKLLELHFKETIGGNVKKSKDVWYFFYQYLAESNHGKLMSVVIAGIDEEQENIRVSLMMIETLLTALNLTTAHMGDVGSPAKESVSKSIEKVRLIMIGPFDS